LAVRKEKKKRPPSSTETVRSTKDEGYRGAPPCKRGVGNVISLKRPSHSGKTEARGLNSLPEALVASPMSRGVGALFGGVGGEKGRLIQKTPALKTR